MRISGLEQINHVTASILPRLGSACRRRRCLAGAGGAASAATERCDAGPSRRARPDLARGPAPTAQAPGRAAPHSGWRAQLRLGAPSLAATSPGPAGPQSPDGSARWPRQLYL